MRKLLHALLIAMLRLLGPVGEVLPCGKSFRVLRAKDPLALRQQLPQLSPERVRAHWGTAARLVLLDHLKIEEKQERG